jgi:membrane protein DedA with SNARE-associated domain
MYYIGRRYGSGPFLQRLERWVGKNAEERFLRLYAKYGFPALFVSRFLPAVRSLVPPLAGR